MVIYKVATMGLLQARSMFPPTRDERKINPKEEVQQAGVSFSPVIDWLVHEGYTQEQATEIIAEELLNACRCGNITKEQACIRVSRDFWLIMKDAALAENYEKLHPETGGKVWVTVVIVGAVLILETVYYLRGETEYPYVEVSTGQGGWIALEGDQFWPVYYVAQSPKGTLGFWNPAWQTQTYYLARYKRQIAQPDYNLDAIYMGNHLTARSWKLPFFVEWVHQKWEAYWVGIGHRSGANLIIVEPSHRTHFVTDMVEPTSVAKIPKRPFWCPPGLDWGAIVDWWITGTPFPW